MVPRPSPARPLSKQAYKTQVLLLREELLAMQQRLRQAPFPVLVLFAGVDGAGKGETVNLLHEWMDPRWLHTHAYGPPSDEERERPEHWRFWRDLPPKGQIGILMNAWYAAPIDRRAHRVTPAAEFRRELQRVARLEQLLTDDGALILKFMMHLDRDTQHARLKALERDPLTRWRVTAEQWRQARSYDELVEAEATAVRLTDASQAPWMLVDGSDERHRSLVVARALRDRVTRRLDEEDADRRPRRGAAVASVLPARRGARPWPGRGNGRPPRWPASTCHARWRRPRTRSRWPRPRGASTSSIGKRGVAGSRPSSSSRAGMPPVRAAPSGASPRRSTRASTR